MSSSDPFDYRLPIEALARLQRLSWPQLALPLIPIDQRYYWDRSSKSVVLCEKRIAVGRFVGASFDDDAGWSDGWDDNIDLETFNRQAHKSAGKVP